MTDYGRGMRDGLLGAGLLFAAAFMIFVAIASAQYSLSVFGLSKHSEKRNYCEFNPGLALNYSLSPDFRLTGGFYKNSLCRESQFQGVVYCPLRFGDACLGTAFVRLTGYSDKALYVPIPMASYERPGFAIDLIGAAYRGKAVVGAGLRFTL